ncbi:PP2C family protein-serine/threonine phosphatase [Desulfohalovibrio reitneri]|uniref:PP2C family protein-serine/threonine phosphatase n=1 Tax=Desulfohalovibrio reitneri TaxID=1307759 RepID=UPI0006905820|nr:GAF domain-containing SpoIIE family protein phosphatase [Desulfohalovibrio reitneri]
MNTAPERLAGRLKHLIAASWRLAEVDSRHQLLEELLDLAQEVVEAEASAILLYNPRRDLLEFAHARNDVLGRAAEDVLKRNIALKPGEGLAGWVAQNRQPALVADAASDPRFFTGADSSTGFVTRSVLCVPILHDEELLGVLQVINPKAESAFTDEDLEILSSFGNLAGVAIIRSRLLEDRLEQERMQAQLDAASRIQTQFWPTLPELPGDSHVYAATIPAVSVGGDLYDCISLADGSLLAYVADVAGKGLPAALVMAALWSRFRSEARPERGLPDLLAALNRSMHELLRGSLFVTMAAARYHPSVGSCELAAAGHAPPLYFRHGMIAEVVGIRGIPLGVRPDEEYGRTSVRLETGDSLLFCTDGVSEARNDAGELFGEDRIQAHAANLGRPPFGPGLVERARIWQSGDRARDDLTVLEIWRGLANEPG